MNPDFILFTAYLEATDPGAPAKSFDAAMAVLKLRPDWFAAKLTTDADPIFNDVSPDRLGLLAGVLNGHHSSPELEAACVAAFRQARSALKSAPGMLPVRRAHALAELLLRLEAFSKLSEDDILWLFEQDEYAAPSLCFGLAVWCRKHPISPAVTELVRSLRAEEYDSPILDRLAATVVPSVEGMMDLARWENGLRCCGDREWQERASRWEEGKPASPEDATALAPTLDPDCSWNAEALKEAIRLHGWAVVSKLLQEARDTTEHPIPRVILNAWLNHFGGDQ